MSTTSKGRKVRRTGFRLRPWMIWLVGIVCGLSLLASYLLPASRDFNPDSMFVREARHGNVAISLEPTGTIESCGPTLSFTALLTVIGATGALTVDTFTGVIRDGKLVPGRQYAMRSFLVRQSLNEPFTVKYDVVPGWLSPGEQTLVKMDLTLHQGFDRATVVQTFVCDQT
jgi:hypothetical protein